MGAKFRPWRSKFVREAGDFSSGNGNFRGESGRVGTRIEEFGSNPDRHRANTKEEDPTGLLNEGFRYRCLETGVFLTRDPAGFVDGPNLYAYVVQNPWTYFDPEGLARERDLTELLSQLALGLTAGEGCFPDSM